MNTRRQSLCALAALALTLSGFGCSIDPQEHSASPLTAPMGATGGLSRDASKIIGPDGGLVERGGVIVEVPPGALTANTRVAIRLRSDGSVDLLPDGQRFNAPVKLHLAPPSGKKASECVIQWFDPAAGSWVTIASSPGGLDRVAPLQHFSIYRAINPVD
jgi:hypothetical protein